jgi:hypothetical protein
MSLAPKGFEAAVIKTRDQANASVERYDYENQAWTVDWHYMACNHPNSMNCECYGKLHAGEFAEEFKVKTMENCRRIDSMTFTMNRAALKRRIIDDPDLPCEAGFLASEPRSYLISEENLAKRETWERCAVNAFQQPDEQVLAMIAEIRRLREYQSRAKGN